MITAWILVIAATYASVGTSPAFSPVVADLASCERLKEASTGGHSRPATCVQIRILK